MDRPRSNQFSLLALRSARVWRAILMGMLASMLLGACTQTPTPTVETFCFRLALDASTAPLVEELVAAYCAERPHVTIELVRAPNAERALQALQEVQADLVSVSWLPERQKAGEEAWYRPFARDAIVMITHPSNPVGDLTLLQLRDIFQGQTLFWRDLGGLEIDILPVSREEGAGTRASFESLVMEGRNVTPTAVVMPSGRAVVEYVSAHPGAIGYVSLGWLAPAVNLLALEGTAPSPGALEEGRYLLARPFYLAAERPPGDGLAEFVEWVSSGNGQEIVRQHYGPVP